MRFKPLSFTRRAFALFPVICDNCKHRVWLEGYYYSFWSAYDHQLVERGCSEANVTFKNECNRCYRDRKVNELAEKMPRALGDQTDQTSWPTGSPVPPIFIKPPRR